MKFKLDENLGNRCVERFRSAGYDVTTVFEEKLYSEPDEIVLSACRAEHRCLVTLDLDFGNPLLFRPSDYDGIAVLRLPPRPSFHDLVEAIQTLLGGLAQSDLTGKLWIVQRGRIRQYQPDN